MSLEDRGFVSPIDTTMEVEESQLVTEDTTECAIQTLYEGEQTCRCCRNWVSECPDDICNALKKNTVGLELKEKALVVRMAKAHACDGGKPLVLDSVVVQSSSLRKTLSEVFKGYQGITPGLQKLVFKAPFYRFHYHWTQFTEILERQKRDDPLAARYTQLLYDILDAELRDARSDIADLLDHGVMTHEHLWALYEPGLTVYGMAGGHERFYIVEGCEYRVKNGALSITLKHVDWDGNRFGYATQRIDIEPFSGTKNITDLVLFPVTFHPSKEEVKARVAARGRMFQNLAGVRYMAYSGVMTCRGGPDGFDLRERQAAGRIVVDAVAYIQADQHSGAQPVLAALDENDTAPQIHTAPLQRPNLDPITPVESSLADTHLLLCAPTVRAFSLTLKTWGLFSVSHIKLISFNDVSFANLMLPANYKDLILSLAEAHTSFTATPASTTSASPNPNSTSTSTPATQAQFLFGDLVQGKGASLVFLLAGNPGTGKTLTAEAVADTLRRPLYVLGAGEMVGQRQGVVENGDVDDDVEARVRGVMERAERWGAVLVLEDCDVLLRERGSGGGGGDEVVAVILRLLESYRGILFLTSNRPEAIDRALHSRIHLTLRYPDLDHAARLYLWRHFIGLSGPVSVHNLMAVQSDLAKLALDGRQIRNTVRMATLLAEREKVPLGQKHLFTVLRGMGEWQSSEGERVVLELEGDGSFST